MIDLHTHTTASDGRLAPDVLVMRAAAAGVRVLAVTDHDTVGGCAAAAAACAAHAIEFVSGIEITAVVDDGDVHVLGYFIDVESEPLRRFLSEQRRQRIERVREAVSRLAAHGLVLDADAIVRPGLADSSRSVGRPWVARALVEAGYVADTNEAFARWLQHGRPAFVPRVGAAPAAVCAHIHAAGGIASLAHPIQLERQDSIAALAADGLDALEAYHSDHDAAATARYLEMARTLNLAVSGGSDYHGDEHGPAAPGCVALPRAEYDRLKSLKSQVSSLKSEV